MNKGLSNFQIDKFFKDEENEEIKKTISRLFLNFHEIIKRKNGKYPFAIFNMDEHGKPGTHWWRFMDIDPQKTYFYLTDQVQD